MEWLNWIRWRCPSDTGFEIHAVGSANYWILTFRRGRNILFLWDQIQAGHCLIVIHLQYSMKSPLFGMNEWGLRPQGDVRSCTLPPSDVGSPQYPGIGGLKETNMFLPHPLAKLSIVGSLRDRRVGYSASDLQGLSFESCVWRAVSSQSSHHPQEVLLAQFSLYV